MKCRGNARDDLVFSTAISLLLVLLAILPIPLAEPSVRAPPWTAYASLALLGAQIAIAAAVLRGAEMSTLLHRWCLGATVLLTVLVSLAILAPLFRLPAVIISAAMTVLLGARTVAALRRRLTTVS